MREGETMEPKVSFDKILDAVARGEDNDWDFVDANLDVNSPEALEFATSEGLISENPDQRDLAYTIWEATQTGMPDEVKDVAIRELNRRSEDSGKYARYRAAFALFVNGDRSEGVKSTLQEAKEDEDTEELARGYLEELGKDNG